MSLKRLASLGGSEAPIAVAETTVRERKRGREETEFENQRLRVCTGKSCL